MKDKRAGPEGPFRGQTSMAKENYDRKMQEEISILCAQRAPSLLLHSCCGPCSSAVLERLCPYFEVTVYYDNPNIHPREEFEKRLSEQKRLLEEIAPAGKKVGLLVGPWDAEEYFSFVRGLEEEPEGGKRCEKCFEFRMLRTARAARERGFELFTSTLTVSPHKDPVLVNAAGYLAQAREGVRYLPSDFKKRDGYLRSLCLSREHHLYRQDYCGCVFSVRRPEEA